MYDLKKIGKYLRVNLLGPGPRIIKKRIYRAAVSQRLRNAGLHDTQTLKLFTPIGVFLESLCDMMS